MEILLLIVIAILCFIAYSLNRTKAVSGGEKLNPIVSTSLNPLFSEEDIFSQRNLSEKWQKRAETYFNNLQRTEREEIEQHQISGKNKSDFRPSTKLKDLILRQSVAITARNTAEARARKMIEANISILNGKSIAEVSNESQTGQSRIPWQNINLDVHAWSSEPEIKKKFEEDLLARTEFWLKSWDFILGKDYLLQDQKDA